MSGTGSALTSSTRTRARRKNERDRGRGALLNLLPTSRQHRPARRVTGGREERVEGSLPYIVVGAGSAGCVLANRRTASGGHRVLLIDAGGEDGTLWIHVPIRYAKPVAD